MGRWKRFLQDAADIIPEWLSEQLIWVAYRLAPEGQEKEELRVYILRWYEHTRERYATLREVEK